MHREELRSAVFLDEKPRIARLLRRTPEGELL
jgi:hypothetical protein